MRVAKALRRYAAAVRGAAAAAAAARQRDSARRHSRRHTIAAATLARLFSFSLLRRPRLSRRHFRFHAAMPLRRQFSDADAVTPIFRFILMLFAATPPAEA
jgi:hypothetical protein